MGRFVGVGMLVFVMCLLGLCSGLWFVQCDGVFGSVLVLVVFAVAQLLTMAFVTSVIVFVQVLMSWRVACDVFEHISLFLKIENRNIDSRTLNHIELKTETQQPKFEH